MNCPVCSHTMIALEQDLVEIDHCPGCAGTWLDAGELDLLLENREKAADLMSALPASTADGESNRNCPICSKHMEKVSCVGVTVDRCRSGDGLWFDDGELVEVLHRVGVENEGPVARFLHNVFGGGE